MCLITLFVAFFCFDNTVCSLFLFQASFLLYISSSTHLVYLLSSYLLIIYSSQVSQHTRRIHLYLCIPGEDSRPRPLFKNFRPEELEDVICSSGDREKETTSLFLKENPAFSSALKAFTKEWNSLRPIDQNKLHGKPLQLPLGLELLYLKESINHNCGVCSFGPFKLSLYLALCWCLINLIVSVSAFCITRHILEGGNFVWMNQRASYV